MQLPTIHFPIRLAYCALLSCVAGPYLTAQSGAWVDRIVTTTFDSPYTVHGADMDGDGDVDMLSASRDDDEVAWYDNVAGDGSLWTKVLIARGFCNPFSAVAADFDGDGDLDALASAAGDDELSWFQNLNGDGSLWSEQSITTGVDNIFGVFAADLDSDGDVDAIVAARNDDEILWFENAQGDGSVWTERLISGGLGQPMTVFAGDVDGDGDLDVLSACADDDTVYWHQNLVGNGTSWSNHVVSALTDAAYSVHGSDLDGDGDLDALSASTDDNDIAWHQNVHGDGTQWTEFLLTSSSSDPLSVVAGDIDLDGDMDATSASIGDNEVLYFRNEDGPGTSFTEESVTRSLNLATLVDLADIDADGDLDVLSSSNAKDRLTWHENRLGQGPFWVRHNAVTTANSAEDVVAADVDGDGDLDLFAALDSFSAESEGVFWFENVDGTGATWTENTVSTDILNPRVIVPADMDGDGDADVVVGSGNSPGLEWYENVAGTGATWTARGILLVSSGMISAARVSA